MGTVDRRRGAESASSVVENLSYALASALHPQDAFASATRWIRETVGEDAAVLIARSDSAGRLRTVWRGGEAAPMGRAQTAARRVAFETRAYSHLDLRTMKDGTAVFFPLVWRESSLGVLEIHATRGGIKGRSGALAVIACQLAGVLAGLAERDGLTREVEALEGVAGLGRELLHAEGPEVALGIVAGALWREFRVPIAIWWGDGQGPRTLTSIAGLNPEKSRRLREQMATVLPWAATTQRERAALRRRFAEIVGGGRVTIRDAGDALVFAASGGPLLQRRVQMLGSLLADTLPLLSRSAREQEQTSRFDVGLAWTAHELRTPILGVKAALESVVGRSEPRDDDLLQRSVRELEQLAADTEGILGWAAGGRELHPQEVDVARLVEDAVGTYRQLHGTEGTVVVDAPPPVVAFADPTHLRAAIVNLVRNAVLYSDPDGVVGVHVTDEGGSVRVSVRDQGPGIPPAERGAIFDPFVRGRAAGRAGDGSGLGLFITRRVVEAHGGRIWVDSDEVGATFHMELPVDGRELQRSAS